MSKNPVLQRLAMFMEGTTSSSSPSNESLHSRETSFCRKSTLSVITVSSAFTTRKPFPLPRAEDDTEMLSDESFFATGTSSFFFLQPECRRFSDGPPPRLRSRETSTRRRQLQLFLYFPQRDSLRRSEGRRHDRRIPSQLLEKTTTHGQTTRRSRRGTPSRKWIVSSRRRRLR